MTELLKFRNEFGTYTVKISAAGFKTFTANDVKIDAGREFPLTAQLEVGQVSEVVTVTAGVEQINSSNGELIRFPVRKSAIIE